MPQETLPTKKIFVMHPKGDKAPLRQCVHFITYGTDYGPAQVDHRCPTILNLDLSKNQPPPKHLCEKFTGQNKKIVDSFFSYRANEEEFRRALKEIWQGMEHEARGGCVAALINCTAGMHRSVAMAETLAKVVGSWDGFKTGCLHLDLEKGKEISGKNAAKMSATNFSEYIPAQGRRRSKHEVRATSEARASEERRRGAAATTDAVLTTKVASFGEKTVSWKIEKLERERHPRERENAGRSADSWEKGENRRRRHPFKQV